MRRLRYQAGFSLIEVVTTLAIIGILAAIVTGQFSGQQNDAKMKADLAQVDQAATGTVSWATGQQNFTEGSRLTGMKVSQLASATSGKFISQTAAASEWVRGAQIGSIPSDDRTMVFTDTTLDGERIRLTRCREYFDQAGKLCARVDIFPWGNSQESAPTLVYRYLQCVGVGCADNQVYAGEDCKKWPVPLPESGSPPAASGPACASATSASFPIVGGSGDPTDLGEAVAAPGLTVPPATDPPAVIAAPSITGLMAVGAELTADRGSWANSPTSYSYQWQVRSSPSSSWTSASGQSSSAKYTLPDQYSGHYLRIKVTAINAIGQSSSYSPTTDQITSAPSCQEPSLSGSSTVGSTKTSDVSCSGSPAPTIAFQWQVSSNGSTWDDLSGSTAASLELTASHSGKFIRLKVTATNSSDSQTVYSPSTARINEAPSNTSIPTISGSAEAGKELTASPGQWRGYPDPDFAYRWQLCNSVGESCNDIQGATSSSYWPLASQAAKTLRVKVTASNTTGQDTAYSEVTAQTVLKPDNTSLPVISGVVEVGKTLTASSGEWDAFPSPDFSYQWRRCNLAGNACSDISSATNSSYAFDSVDSELSVRVVVTATNSGGSASATSAAVSENDRAPANTSLPSFSGTAKVGETLTGAVGVWSGYPAPTYAYQWQSCDLGGVNCSDITGYTSPTISIPVAQASWRIRLKIIASNRANSSVAAYSSPSDAVVRPPFNDSIPEISGTVKVGQTISSSQGQWSGYPTPTYSYQWQVASDSSGEWTSATGIGNSSSSYVVDAADAGKFLRIQVTAQNSQDTVSAYSQTTSAASWLPANISLPVVSGDAQSGATLTSTSGSWTGFPSPSFSTMWQSQSQAVAITGGGYNTCVLRSDGTVWCWGQGAYGAIGNGSVADRWTPTQVSGISTATSISGAYGGNSFCAVLADTTAKCWGYNPSGILGDGTTTNRSTPVTVAGLSGVKAIEAVFGERSQACAVKLDGTVWCWGAATYGQLDGTLGPASLTPVQVRGIDNAEGVTIGTGHTCSNLSDGTVWCWGGTYTGALGGTREDFTSTGSPVRVIGVNDALSVSANYYSTCAALSSGKVKCWGNNGKRQSGDNRQAVQNASAYQLPTLTDVKSLKGANQTQCAVLNSGQVACWGQNNNGQLGDSTLVDNAVPQIVPGISSAVGAFGGGHSCALLSSGEIKCWGGVYLGNNTGSSSLTPVTVNSLAGAWTDSSPSSSYLLPASVSGSVVRSAVTAANAAGSTLAYSAQTDRIDQIASNSVAPSISGSMSSGSTLTAQAGTWSGRPAPSYAYKWQTQDRPTEVRTALGQSCSLRSDGTVWCWGVGSNGILGWGSALGEVWQASKVAAVSSATKLSMGVSSSSTACVLLSDKTVKCWGMGTSGQLGNGALLSSPAAVTVTGLSDAVDISTGTSSCAVKTDGTVWCWGSNGQGQLGDGTTTTQSSPVQVVGISNAIVVSTGNGHTCALLASLTVKCWGMGNYGQLGNSASANSSTPVTVTGLSGVKSISSGQLFSCALLSSGSVKCWGYGLNGRLGNGAAANSNIPVTVLDESSSAISATQMLVGYSNVCAVLTSGKVGCWGQGAKIDVGDSSLLAEAPGISSALQVSAGSPFCSLLVDRSIKCWGTDQYGSLGAGTSNNFRSAPLMPVEVNDFSSSWTAAASGSSYQTQAGDNGKFVRVKVTASNQAGSRSVFSDPAAQVTAAPNNSVLPTIFGEVKVGLTVTASPGFWTWTGSVSPAYSYQWQIASSSSGPWTSASGSGNSSSSYLLTSAESSKFLRVRITAQNPDGTAFAYSDVSSVAALPPTNTVAPVIVGGTTPGSTLTASSGTWTGSPTAYSYQWQRCDLNGSQCTSIGSDSSTYTLVNADAAYTIKLQVTASNVAGSVAASSTATSVIASASGCTLTTSGLYTIHTCTTVGSSTINTYRTLSADYLVVAGGGGGGSMPWGNYEAGGGGGGGGFLTASQSVVAGSYAVTIGGGGAGGTPTTPAGTNGSSSSFASPTIYGRQATGGGGGGSGSGGTTNPPKAGGSGGGAGGCNGCSYSGASGTNGQGYSGGNNLSQHGGGGGGVSSVGNTVANGGGGNGLASSISGSSTNYGGGGGGGGTYTAAQTPNATGGSGGAGGGGAGGNGNAGSGAAGTVNTGGGGGGGAGQASALGGSGGAGGSGVVIVRYLTRTVPANTALPTVSGAVNNGSVLAGYAGTWTGEPAPALTYQWQVASAATGATWTSATGSGATSLNYTVASADAGKYLRLTVTGTSTSGIASASSAASSMVIDKPINTVLPGVSGVANVGSTLTSDSGTWTGAAPISYAYQWQVQQVSSAILGTTGSAPEGITVDSAGNIYTANVDSNNVSKITPAGVSTTLGTTGTTPVGITIDAAGNVYTANYSSNNVSKITPAGVSTIIGNTGTSPRAITVDSAGNLYTANEGSANVSKITPAGVSTILGTTGSNPRGITIDSAGNLYTVNYVSNNVSKITPAGVSSILGTTGSRPRGITIDSAGNVYTTNYNSSMGTNNVSKITSAGVSTANWASPGYGVYGITIDSAGNLYTANTVDSTVSKITPAGTSTVNWGPGGAQVTTGMQPQGITVDSAGNLYTANNGSNNVSKITQWASAAGAGSTTSSYVPAASDSGKTLRSQVTASNSYGSTVAYSTGTSVNVAPVNTVVPVIAGTLTPGSTLTATSGTWTGSPTAYSYQWQRCDLNGLQCTNVGTDSSTYTLVNADAGQRLKAIVTASNVAGSASAQNYSQTVASASGGTVTYSGGYTVHSFATTGSSSLTAYRTLSADYLVVAGGGAGGPGYAGGGGGAGGMLTGSGVSLAAGAHSVTVGAGGTSTSTINWTQGGNSMFADAAKTAAGGGAGGKDNSTTAGNSGGSGGGGGGAYGQVAGAGNTPAAPNAAATQGNNGGKAVNGPSTYGGGGGGGGGLSGTVGIQGGNTDLWHCGLSPCTLDQPAGYGGPGGNGTSSSISGSSVTYAGGGGGGGESTQAAQGAGGLGGGGRGSGAATQGLAGTNGLGGGGGGGGGRTNNNIGGAGGSGVVIIRYLTPSVPVNTSLPTTSSSSGVITGVAGSWTGNPAPALTYQWQVASAATGATWASATGTGATSLSYTPASADTGKYLRLTVTGTSTSGVTVASSAASLR